MLLENRLKRKRINDDTFKDNQDVGDDSPLTKIAAALAIGAGVYGAYRKGWLKPVVHKSMELMETISAGSTDKAYQAASIIKAWTKDAAHSPRDSIFRRSSIDNFKAVVEAIKDNGIADNAKLKSMIDSTVDDLSILKESLKSAGEDISLRKNDYKNTDLARKLSEFRSVSREMNTNLDAPEKVHAAQKEMFRELMSNKKTFLSTEDEAFQMTRNGMRHATLSDFYEKPFIDDYGNIVMKVKNGMTDILEETRFGKDNKATFNEIFSGGQNSQFRYAANGRVTSAFGDWENLGRLKIDNNIYINEVGNIIDTRMSADMIRDLKRSLATDFEIPGLGFNPIATLTKWGRSVHESFFGLIDAGSYQPGITGKAGKIAAGSVSPDGGHMFFAGDKLFGLSDVPGGGAVKLGEGFEFHDISRVNEFGFNRTLKGTMKIADLTDTEFVEKTNRKHADFVDKIYRELRLSREVKSVEKFNPDGTRIINSNPLVDDELSSVPSMLMHPFLAFENKVVKPFMDKISPYDMSINKVPEDIYNSKLMSTINEITNKEWKARQFVAVKKGTGIVDIIESQGAAGKADKIMKMLKETFYSGQLTDGTLKNFTTNTVGFYNLFDAVFDRLGNIAPMLRFENKDKKNIWQYGLNIFMYRALPIYGLLRVPGMINALSEPIFGLLGFNHRNKKEDKYNDNNMNLGKFVMKGVEKADIAFHGLKDLTGLTTIFKTFGEYFAGADQLNEIPGIYQLGLGQTKEEREEYIEKGFDPVRKGRYWTMNNTPFTGGKIDKWRPNIYRRVQADVMFSDSKWGSRQEYYSHGTWLPNPVNPLGFINKLNNPNYYDYKHYKDRPYLMTAPQGEHIPIIGHAVAGTIGQYSQHKMHEEYWKDNKPVEKNDEAVPELTEAQYDTAWTGEYDLTPGPIPSGGGGLAGVAMDFNARMKVSELKSRPGAFILRKINEFLNADQLAQEAVMIKDLQNVREQMQMGSIRVTDILKEQIPIARTRSYGGTVNASIIPRVTDNTFSTYMSQFKFEYQGNPEGQYELYSTPSGGLSIVDVPSTLDLWTANVAVSNYSLNRLYGTKQRVQVNDPNRFTPELKDYSDVYIKSRGMYQLGEQFNTLTDFLGMKGYEFRTFVSGSANKDAKQIETSGYSYSFNKSFWDMDIGGMLGVGEAGEETSEIFRRFVQKRNKSTEYINPIRNTMPSWMPGRDGFIDFKHGDSYSKITNGEERLPGEGYERMYDINQEKMFNLSIGSSYIGKSEDEMVKHLLGDTEIDIEDLKLPDRYGGGTKMDAASQGTKIHNKVEKAWTESGLAIQTEGEFYDEKHDIKGFYDALIHDPLSRTGQAIVDIKTVNNEKFQSVLASGAPLYEHQSQVNYYLYATGNQKSKGYVYYINRDDPTQRTTVGFNYNPELLRENLETLKNARNRIYEGLREGTIGRGELYSNLDRYRILADVAPYSQELKNVKAALSFEEHTPDEEKEISEIGERLTAQKEPLRVYDYKFSSAKNVKTEVVKVKEILDNNHIIVNKYGRDHAITFAGMRVSQSNSDMYDEDRTMNEAAYDELKKYLRPGKRIRITYDARDDKKFNKDTTDSIKAAVMSGGVNVNKRMINKGLATEKDQETPAAMRARYSGNQIAVGSVLEKMTHGFAQIPFIGNKWLHVKSPYEEYRDMEVYGKIC